MVKIVRGSCQQCKQLFEAANTTGKYCSNRCQQDYRYENDTLPRILSGQISERRILRRYLLKHNGHACESCKGTEWLGHPMPLELDHVDGDASNNQLTNLRMICANCHSLTPTAKGRNRGNGRKARGLPVK